MTVQGLRWGLRWITVTVHLIQLRRHFTYIKPLPKPPQTRYTLSKPMMRSARVLNQPTFKTTIIAAAAVFTALFAYWCIPPLIANPDIIGAFAAELRCHFT